VRQPVPEFFNGEHGKAGREHALVDREARHAETRPASRRQAVKPPSDPQVPVRCSASSGSVRELA
jgi:hypothetical protein